MEFVPTVAVEIGAATGVFVITEVSSTLVTSAGFVPSVLVPNVVVPSVVEPAVIDLPPLTSDFLGSRPAGVK